MGKLEALQSKQTELFEPVREFLVDLSDLLADAEKLHLLEDVDCSDLIESVAEPFSVFICGEFNSGKSSLLNKIVGSDIAEVGVIPTTSKIAPLSSEEMQGVVFVDSPGTNSIMEGHEETTERYLRRADFVLFVTSVERPLAESEVKFLSLVSKKWRRKFVLVVNKIDQLDPVQIEKVQKYVLRGVKEIFNFEPPCFLTSTKSGAGIEELKKELFVLLSEKERIRLKLQGPVRTSQVLIGDAQTRSSAESKSLQDRVKIYEKVLERSSTRCEEASLLFDALGDRSKRTFSELARGICQLIDERIGLMTVLRSKVFGNQENLKSAIHEIIEELEFESKLQGILDETAQKVVFYRSVLLTDARDYLEAIPEFNADEVDFIEPGRGGVDAAEVAKELKESTERGMNSFLVLGGAAAASGLGAQIAALGTIEFTGMILMFALALFSLRAFPNERNKIKRHIEENFDALAGDFALTVRAGVNEQLQSTLDSIQKGVEPGLNESLESLKQIQEFEVKAKGLRARLLELDDKISKLAS